MSRPIRLFLAASSFIVLAIICLLMSAPRIEDDIRERSTQTLATSGIVGLTLDVSGRDVSLTGNQPQLDRAMESLASVRGIRITTLHPVDSAVVTPPRAAEPAVPVPQPTTADMDGRIRDLIDGRPIRFRTGSAELLEASTVILDELAVLLGNVNFHIEIEGHTDATGSAQRNLVLSQQRADAVLAYLVSRGISAARMTATGVGAARPVATNGTAAGRQRNRRIEFNVTSPN